MKKIYIALVILITATFCNKIYAQTEVLSATVQQGDKTSIFYGPNAFVEAIKIVKDSTDVINLSSGTFNSTTINKACIIYGAGFERDTVRNVYPTILGSIKIKPDLAPDDEGNMVNLKGALDGLHIEGISVTDKCIFEENGGTAPDIYNILLRRCYFGDLRFKTWEQHPSPANSCPHNSKIINCIIGELYHHPNAENVGVYNCIMGKTAVYSNLCYNKDVIIKNCIIFNAYNFGCVYKDNIFISNNIDFYDAQETASFFSHNIATHADYFKYIDANRNDNNWAGKATIGIFGEDVGNGYDSKYSYKLKEGNASIYVGSDGKEVGLYGGDYPFSKIPSNPQILSKEIDVQTTTDGKLKVSVKIEAQP